jgi:hypothetical protein
MSKNISNAHNNKNYHNDNTPATAFNTTKEVLQNQHLQEDKCTSVVARSMILGFTLEKDRILKIMPPTRPLSDTTNKG